MADLAAALGAAIDNAGGRLKGAPAGQVLHDVPGFAQLGRSLKDLVGSGMLPDFEKTVGKHDVEYSRKSKAAPAPTAAAAPAAAGGGAAT